MASTGPNSPGTIVNDSAVGTVAWTNPSNAGSSDDSYATISAAGYDVYDEYIKIVKADGTIGTTNKANTGAWAWDYESYISYGGSTDLWGETWTPSDINDADFGVVMSIDINSDISNYLKATNFAFSIPTGATINGILAEFETINEDLGGANVAKIDHIRITVYYTEATGTNMKINISDTWKDVSAMKINIGDTWKDVSAVKINVGDTWKDIF
jgi:hypothetical protein